MIFLHLLFWISVFLIFHTYVLFPIILQILAQGREKNPEKDLPADPPNISILIAAYNEEDLIRQKVESVLNNTYPREKLEILLASDASTDNTDRILLELQSEFSQVKSEIFEQRTGKPGLINHLAGKAAGEILVITDANVMLEKETLSELVRPFKEQTTGLVDTQMINTSLKRHGISHQEKFYISREVRIKHQESILWGSMMGPFGGCYAVKRSLYRPVPGNFLVDDFYINMAVLQQGYDSISNISAKVHEDVSNDLKEEFRRKKRISAGNFQNLGVYFPLLFSGKKGVAICFLSHKVLRWLVPFLVVLTLGSSAWLGSMNPIYLWLAILQGAVLILPLVDRFLRLFRIHILPLRFISHFVVMNFALLAGFFQYIGGIKNNVWEPTRRNQD